MTHSGFVAIIGRPNAGKSTLLNRVLGSKVSIVTPKAQTTRERVLGILTEEDKGQIVFIDTPGIHRAKEGGINQFMVEEARGALEAPNVVWYLVDPSSAVEHEKAVLEILEKAGKGLKVFVLLNKTDVVKRPDFVEHFAALEAGMKAELDKIGITDVRVLKLSGRYGEGVDELLAETWKEIPEGPMYYPDPDQISDRPVRYFVAEKIRQQLLMHLGEEVPYSCAVEIERYQDPRAPGEIPRIEAIIHVERDSQKGMVIGKGGSKIKEIGQAARREIEAFVGSQVFLGLRVNVLKDWSKDAEALKRMGYALPESRDTGKKGKRPHGGRK